MTIVGISCIHILHLIRMYIGCRICVSVNTCSRYANATVESKLAAVSHNISRVNQYSVYVGWCSSFVVVAFTFLIAENFLGVPV